MVSDTTTMTTRRYVDVQSPIRALLYAIAVWFVWVSLIVTAAQALTAGISGGSPLFVWIETVALAALVLGSTILYLRKVGEVAARRGGLSPRWIAYE